MHEYYERKINNHTKIETLKQLLEKNINLLRRNWKIIFLQSKTKNYPPNILKTKELETMEKPLIAIINVDCVLPTLI